MVDEDFDYEIPKFIPKPLQKKQKQASKKNKQIRTNHKESKKTGQAGEDHVFKWEVEYLKKNGRDDLSERVVKQSEDHTNYPGYDIKSFDLNGDEIFIEVKSTSLKTKNFFEITHNEWIKGSNSAKKMGKNYFIYIVVDARKHAKIIARIPNPYKLASDNEIKCTPTNYRIEYDND